MIELLFALAPHLSDLDYLHQVALEVTRSASIATDEVIPGAGANTTGFALRVPGGTKTYYPAFWIRDAAMMLGSDLVPRMEVEGWIKVVASTQPGPAGLKFDHALTVPPFSIPDHITLQGAACWFPGAYADQGVGNYGFLPPADDAFYFIQMVHEAWRLGNKAILNSSVKTAWGVRRLSEICVKVFDSVAADSNGLVVCDAEPGKGRVDWGFCDSITKTGECLMPSLLRWQAARRLAAMFDSSGRHKEAGGYKYVANQIQTSLSAAFLRVRPPEAFLLSSTGLGQKDDVWASAFAVFLGVLPGRIEKRIARHLLNLYLQGGTVEQGQVRQVPPSGEFGGAWEKAPPPGTYQNGGFWATPTGWMIVALGKVDRRAADRMLSEFTSHLREFRSKGAPFEWINPAAKRFVNPNYGSSAGLVFITLEQSHYLR